MEGEKVYIRLTRALVLNEKEEEPVRWKYRIYIRFLVLSKEDIKTKSKGQQISLIFHIRSIFV